MQYGALLARVPNRSADAVSSYRSALEIYKESRDWRNQEVILFRLSKLYQEAKQAGEEQRALQDRVATLAQYFHELDTGHPRPDAIFLVSEYLYSIRALASFYTRARMDDAAEAACQEAAAAFDYINGNIHNELLRRRYADMLDEYKELLEKKNKRAQADEVALKEKTIRPAKDQIGETAEPADQAESSPPTP